jgi:hypothetical protein
MGERFFKPEPDLDVRVGLYRISDCEATDLRLGHRRAGLRGICHSKSATDWFQRDLSQSQLACDGLV